MHATIPGHPDDLIHTCLGVATELVGVEKDVKVINSIFPAVLGNALMKRPSPASRQDLLEAGAKAMSLPPPEPPASVHEAALESGQHLPLAQVAEAERHERFVSHVCDVEEGLDYNASLPTSPS